MDQSRRAPRLGPWLLVCAANLGCTPTEATTTTETTTEPSPPADDPPADDPPSTTPPTPLPPDQSLEKLALDCNGHGFAQALGALELIERETLVESGPPSTRLMALWEQSRTFDAEGKLEPSSVEAFAPALAEVLGQDAPHWWLDQLRTARLSSDEGQLMPSYDLHLREDEDRRGRWSEGPGSTRVRPGDAAQLSSEGGRLQYELSMGRIDLGALPSAGRSLELARARAGSTIYWASFEAASGGFRFPLHASTPEGVAWEAEVCGPNRMLLGGLGHLTVEVRVLAPPAPATTMMAAAPAPTGVAVFSAESHGVALDVFDPSTGERIIAWSSDLWFQR